MTGIDPFGTLYSGQDEDRIEGSRTGDARAHNRRLVFETVFQRGPISRVEIAGYIQLKPQTISSITRELLEQGLIKEAGRSEGLRGQPQIYLEANAKAGYSIGVHLDEGCCTLLMLDLKRQSLAKKTIPCDTANPETTIKALVGVIEETIAELKIERQKIWGIGLVLPAFGSDVYDFDFSLSHWEAWRNVDFAKLLQEQTGISVLAENDATAAAVGERMHRPETVESSFVYFFISNGIGAGLIIDGYPFKGFGGNAGEIGFLPLAGLGASPTWQDDPKFADQPSNGLLSLQTMAQVCGFGAKVPPHSEFLRRLEMRDAALMSWIANAAQVLRDAAAVLEVVVDPEFIAVGGGLPAEITLHLVNRAYPLRPTPASRRDRTHPRLIPATLIENAAVTGAAYLPFFVHTSHKYRRLYLRRVLTGGAS